MKTSNSNDAELLTAASIVARHENVSVDFVFARYNTNQILGWCKAYNDQHLEEMDAIRQWW